MRLAIRFGSAIILCLALSVGLRAVPPMGGHALARVASRAPHLFPSGSVRLYRTSADAGVLRPVNLRSLADMSGPLLHTGLVPEANQYPAVVATSDGSRYAVMQDIHPNRRVVRGQDLTLQLFDSRTGTPISSLRHPSVPVWMMGVSVDGSIGYGFRDDSNSVYGDLCAPTPFYLLDTRTGRVLLRLSVAAKPWDSILIGPNLQRLYTLTMSDHINSCGPRWSYSPTVTAYSLQTGKVVRAVRLKGVLAGRWETSHTINGDPIGGDWSPGFALSPDGSQLAILDGHDDTLTLVGTRRLRMAATERVARPQSGLNALVATLGVRPDVVEAKGQWNGANFQMQYTADGHSLLVTGARLSPDSYHRYAASHNLGIQLIDVASGQIRAWLNDQKQVIGLWSAPDGGAMYSSVQTWSRAGGWLITLRRHDPATLQVRADRAFPHMGNWWL
ncbi:MAG: hypothetical protein DLM70_18800, partial [Chloroflexi bacterium]